MYPKETRKSIILKIMFSKNKIEKVDFIPTRLNKNHQPELLDSEEAEKVIQKINRTPIILTEGEYKKRLKLYRRQLKLEWAAFLFKNMHKLPLGYLLRYTYSFIKRKTAKLLGIVNF
jgi:hypothetical protein